MASRVLSLIKPQIDQSVILKKALQCPKRDMWLWIDVIKIEMDKLFRNKTFKDDPLPKKATAYYR